MNTGSRSLTVTIISKPDCSLCDSAEARVDEVVAEWQELHSEPVVSVQVINMLDDPELIAKYSEDVPVVLIDGRVHTFWKVDADRLMAALDHAAIASTGH